MNDLVAPPVVAEAAAPPHIGRRVVRPNARRLTEGRGTYVDDVELPRMAHVVYLRSPHAHARVVSVDVTAAHAMPGVIAIVDGARLAQVCAPFVGTLSHMVGMRSAPQYAIAIDRACWQGEAVLAIVADTRALAEDAVETIVVEWEPLPAVADMETALAPQTPVIHAELGSNLCYHRELDTGGGRRRLCRCRRGRRGNLCLRPPYRSDPWSRARCWPTSSGRAAFDRPITRTRRRT
jgi:carbon-monoxide dehydrogenase large subunit